jgi:hypothetical protein
LPPLEIDYLRAFFARGGIVFLGVFRENWCANVVFLHGKCGEVVVKTWWETDIKSALKSETGFQGLFSV